MMRHRVKPGITGWAQVNGFRGQTDTLRKMSDRVEHDLYYIQHWTFRMDLRIIAHGDLRMDGPQCLLGDEPRRCALPRGHACGPAEPDPRHPDGGAAVACGELCWRPPVVVVRPG